jgi:multicomponent Na+:H+ antiporter subunit C
MILVLAIGAGGLFACGIYLVLERTLTRVVIGFALMAHGANLVLLAAGGRAGDAPIVGDASGALADPLAQAMILTAIVISFAVTAFMLALAYRSWLLTRDDRAEDDLEDRRIAQLEEHEAEQ